tara:strand:+ start:1954 stop:2238 length:285 start_codon:yes stop_codon:yes gene_type:complete
MDMDIKFIKKVGRLPLADKHKFLQRSMGGLCDHIESQGYSFAKDGPMAIEKYFNESKHAAQDAATLFLLAMAVASSSDLLDEVERDIDNKLARN